MPATQYVAWSVTAGEQPTVAKWNILGTNDSSFNTGAGFNDQIIAWRHLATDMIPAGVIWQWAGAGTPSSNWLMCDGSAVSRSTYAALFAAIGTTYGAGDTTTTFNLPNLAGRVPVGYKTSDGNFGTRGQTGGEVSHTLTTNEMPVHNHGVYDPGHAHTVFGKNAVNGAAPTTNDAGVTWGYRYEGRVATDYSGTGISIYNAGSGWAHNNLQPYLVLNFIIKT